MQGWRGTGIVVPYGWGVGRGGAQEMEEEEKAVVVVILGLISQNFADSPPSSMLFSGEVKVECWFGEWRHLSPLLGHLRLRLIACTTWLRQDEACPSVFLAWWMKCCLCLMLVSGSLCCVCLCLFVFVFVCCLFFFCNFGLFWILIVCYYCVWSFFACFVF